MKATFKPPSLDRLTEVDIAECEYGKSLVEVEGVVSPSGQGGWPRTENYSVHCFSFAAWRRPGEDLVQKNSLTILRPVPVSGDWWSEYPELSLQRISVLLSGDETRAIFANKSKTKPQESGLIEIADNLAKPVTIATERFGDLTLNRSIGWFEGNTNWCGESISIHFVADETQDISASLAVADELWTDQLLWKKRVGDYAVRKLLQLKNEDWLDDGESPLTAMEFKASMTLESITIRPDGSMNFWHRDGGLFFGHAIEVSGTHEEGLTDAGISG